MRSSQRRHSSEVARIFGLPRPRRPEPEACGPRTVPTPSRATSCHERGVPAVVGSADHESAPTALAPARLGLTIDPEPEPLPALAAPMLIEHEIHLAAGLTMSPSPSPRPEGPRPRFSGRRRSEDGRGPRAGRARGGTCLQRSRRPETRGEERPGRATVKDSSSTAAGCTTTPNTTPVQPHAPLFVPPFSEGGQGVQRQSATRDLIPLRSRSNPQRTARNTARDNSPDLVGAQSNSTHKFCRGA